MSNFAELAGKLAGIISLIAFIPYIYAILKGETKPNRASWWLWTVVGFMLGGSYYASGADETIWVPVSYIIGPLITAILSIRYGEGGWTRFDKLCLGGAGASLILWFAFETPLIALTINLFIDSLGALPTIKKAYYEPEKEDRTAWALFFAGNIINLFAVKSWTFSIAAYPIYMFLGSGLIAILVFRKVSLAKIKETAMNKIIKLIKAIGEGLLIFGGTIAIMICGNSETEEDEPWTTVKKEEKPAPITMGNETWSP